MVLIACRHSTLSLQNGKCAELLPFVKLLHSYGLCPLNHQPHFPILQHCGINDPPDRLLRQSADNYFMLYLAESLTGRSYTEEKLLRYYPLWREGKGRKLCLLSANSYGIWYGVKRNVFFLQRVRMQKLINGSMRNVFLSGERGGPSDPRRMVESRILYVGIRGSMKMF